MNAAPCPTNQNCMRAAKGSCTEATAPQKGAPRLRPGEPTLAARPLGIQRRAFISDGRHDACQHFRVWLAEGANFLRVKVLKEIPDIKRTPAAPLHFDTLGSIRGASPAGLDPFACHRRHQQESRAGHCVGAIQGFAWRTRSRPLYPPFT